jgi:hypothetical protein
MTKVDKLYLEYTRAASEYRAWTQIGGRLSAVEYAAKAAAERNMTKAFRAYARSNKGRTSC